MSLLEIHGLGITFGGLRAVHDVAFSVEPGEIVSVIGPNGAGKTTLFNMISGIYRPGAGRVVLDRDDVTGMAPFRLARRGMSRTFQNLQIFQNMTVLENAIAGFHLQEQGALLSDLFNLRACGLAPGAPKKAPARSCSAWAWNARPNARPPASPTARSSGWRSPARWPCSPRCCCWTNRPPAAMRSKPRKSTT